MRQSIILTLMLSLLVCTHVDVALAEKADTRNNSADSIPRQSYPTEYHVVRDGQDTNPGTLEQPFATAAAALRQIRPGDTLCFHEGRYAAADGNVLDLSELTGTADLPITITNWRDDNVTLHGTRVIAGDGWTGVEKGDALFSRLREGAKWKLMLWEKDSASNEERLIPDEQLTHEQNRQVDMYIEEHFGQILQNVYKKSIDENVWQLFQGPDMEHLEPLTVARFPNALVWSEEMWDRDLSLRWISDESRPGHFVDHPTRGSIEKLAGQKVSFAGAVLVANFQACFSDSALITHHRAGAGEFDYELRGSSEKLVEQTYKIVYYIEGVAALDSPGEWFFQRSVSHGEYAEQGIAGGTLFVWMPDGRKPDADDLIVARNTDDLLIAGSNTSYVGVDGLHFYAGNIDVRGSLNVTVKNCEFLYPACSKRAMGMADTAPVVDFRSSESFTFLNNVIRYSDGAIKGDKAAHTRIENNLFSHIDYASLGSMTLTVSGPGPQVRYNTLEYSGCSEGIKGQYSQYPDDAAGPESSVVEYNYLTHMGLIQWDGAAFQNVDVTLRNNWGTWSRRMGIRNDQYNNIPIHLMYRNVTLGNEIALAADFHQCFHNTIVPKGPSQRDPCLEVHTGREGNRNTLVRNNAADSFAGEWPPVTVDKHDVCNWNSRKQITDLRDQLRDPDNLDFRPRPDSSLIDAGMVVDRVLWPPDWDSRRPVLELSKPFDVSATYNGAAPDFGAYEFGDTWYWIPGRVERKATHPVPPDRAVDVKLDADLMWREAMGDVPVETWITFKRRASVSGTPRSRQMMLPGGKTAKIAYDVYFGTDRNAVASAGKDDPPYRGYQEHNIFTPGPLNPNTEYFWRVDVVARDWDAKTRTFRERVVETGDVWEFTTEDPTIHRAVFHATEDVSARADAECADTECYVLEMASDRQVLLKFAVRDVPENAEITSATLRLRTGYRPIEGNVSIYRVADTTWTEETIDTINQPIDKTLLGTLDEGIDGNAWVHINVTEALAASGNAFCGNSKFAFALNCSRGGPGQGFRSTELQAMRYDGLLVQPELIVEYRLLLRRVSVRPTDDAYVCQVRTSEPASMEAKAETRLMQDAWVAEGNFGTHPTDESLYLGCTGGAQTRALLEFRVQNVVKGATIDSARLAVLLQENRPVDLSKLAVFQIDNDWQDKFIHGNNYDALHPRRVDNVRPLQRGREITFDLGSVIADNGLYSFAIESSAEEDLRIAGRLHKTSDESRLDVRFRAPYKSLLHVTVDDYRKYLRFGMPESERVGNMAVLKFVVSELPAGIIRKATIRLEALTDITEVRLYRLAYTDWEETPDAPQAITGKKLNTWLPENERVPLKVAEHIREGDMIIFDVADVITREGVYAFSLASPDKGAAAFCRETLATMGTSPQLILDIESLATQAPSDKEPSTHPLPSPFSTRP